MVWRRGAGRPAGTLTRIWARLAPAGAPWPVVFLHLVSGSARAGARILTALRDAQAAGAALADQQDRRSKLPEAVTLLLRYPALTAPVLTRQLGITPQATLRLLARLVDAGVVRKSPGGTASAPSACCSDEAGRFLSAARLHGDVAARCSQI